ncbi:MAG: WbuC family cupin fold metalloprotein [Bacteroidales bacterium]|jgi:cupin fold WbuC family metalloprotein|nr:WbuC family cupin fold metalloprotein [Bacteroidales bacterium]MDD3160732.1 WbuC family cupin fold metalloprotein [Bacteroidales bacterium]
MKLISSDLLDLVTASASSEERLRKNFNFHTDLNDTLHRFLNAMEPGTYIAPHRHVNPDKEETVVILRGSLMIFLFDETGKVAGRYLLNRDNGLFGIDIEPGLWHCSISLEPGTIIFEVKRGPFAPLTAECLAPWAPDAADKEAAQLYMRHLLENECL